MFVQSMKFIEAHHGNKRNISVYGQEYTNTTYKLAKMNLAIRGIASNLGAVAADTFHNDQHKDLKADFIMANPPLQSEVVACQKRTGRRPTLGWLRSTPYEQCQLRLDPQHCL
jgi:type I restriction-modification system DNA methylase subunit